VMSLPTLLLFIDGAPVRRLVGARGIARLRQELDEELSSAIRGLETRAMG
jgi:thioredoxin 1